MARKNRYTSTLVLAGLVLAASGYYLWDLKRVPDTVLNERRTRLVPAFRRDVVTRLEFAAGGERFQLAKGATGWQVTSGQRQYPADESEVDRLMMEAEVAAPTRRLGPLDAAS